MWRLIQLAGLVVLTFAFYRLILLLVPVLPWEPKVVETPGTTTTGGTPPPPQRTTLRIGVGDRVAHLPFYALKTSLGSGLSVELIKVDDASERWTMLATGQLDMACGTLDSFALALARSGRGSYLFSIANSLGSDALVGQQTMKKVDELNGKRIAVPRGGPAEYLLAFSLDKVGLSLSQTVVVPTYTAEQALQLLLDGKVEGAVLNGSTLARARSKEFAVLAETGSDAAPPLEDICAVSPSALKSQRVAIQKVLRAYFSVADTLRTNPGIGRMPISQGSGLSASDLAEWFKRVQFHSLEENQTMDQNAVLDRLRKAQDFWLLIGTPNAGRTADLEDHISLDVILELSGR